MSVFALFQNGGKQHRAKEGQIVRLDKLDVKVGETVEFSEVLMIANDRDIRIGFPFIKGSVIRAKIVAHGRNEKIKILKFRRRKHYRRQQGHRQWFTDIKIVDIISS